MRTVELIIKKRDGGELETAEIESFIQGVTEGAIPDYQVAAWLMAVVWRGMSSRETADLTMSMVRSGETLDLSDIAPWVVDKHSSGGVGDKTTLVVAPVVAAWDMPVAKMSGRGLSFSGGTLDKLESIRGYRVDLSRDEFLANLRRYGIVLSGQTGDLAPADGKLYALRDVTGTVESIPLIASSIMSKKIAAGANALVLDVKVGQGAFMKTIESATTLARTMIGIGKSVGRQVTVVISNMDQPLGCAVGNALEVKEAIRTLQGDGPPDFAEHCEAIAAEMLLLGHKCPDVATGRRMVQQAIADGRALLKFRLLVEAQGGDPALVDHPERLPQAALVEVVPAPQSGYIAGIDAMAAGMVAVDLGAGRMKKGDPIDHGVGLVLPRKVGEFVEAGQSLFEIHANRPEQVASAKERLLAAHTWSDEPVASLPLIHDILREA